MRNMFIGYPKYRLGETAWFLSKTDQLVHGMIQLITITIKRDESNIWYSMIDLSDNQYTVKETEVIDSVPMPKPKYKVGDVVSYEYLSTENKQVITEGVIGRVEVCSFSPDDPSSIEVYYYMDDDMNFYITDDEILGFANPRVITLTDNDDDIVSEYTGDEQCSLGSLRP